jgi:hypothetical protein
MVMAMNSEYRGSASGVAAPKKKAATRKTVVTPGTKVSQATIDKIKAMGMTKALKGAAGASPEMREALKRMYGAKRVAAAGGSSKPAASSADAARAGANKGVVYKSADAARNAAMNKKPTVRIPSAAGFGGTNMPNKNTKPGNFGTGSVSRAGTNMPNKPTPAQVAAAKARAGGNTSVYSSSRTGRPKTQAQIAKEAREAAARKKAVAAARKAAGGRNI